MKLPWSQLTRNEKDAAVALHIFDSTRKMWPYTEDLEHAFKIVEIMRREGLACQLDNGLDGTWDCQFYKPCATGAIEAYYAPADSLPEAICKAALIAKGIELYE